jgi:hypothetical protein
MGYDATKANQNILRLLESFGPHGSLRDSLWHPKGLIWSKDVASSAWTATPHFEFETQLGKPHEPRLFSLSFSDDRTALVKLEGTDGLPRFLSLLRLDPDDHHSKPANDGWLIVREIIGVNASTSTNAILEIYQILQEYLHIEHSTGTAAAEAAKEIFASDASLLAVGSSPHNEHPTDWAAPVGQLLSVSLDKYLRGLANQTPHCESSMKHDAILQVDVLPCQTAAAVTIQVGNGAQTTLFVDHLLLGCKGSHWKILSKTFTPRSWPSG